MSLYGATNNNRTITRDTIIDKFLLSFWLLIKNITDKNSNRNIFFKNINTAYKIFGILYTTKFWILRELAKKFKFVSNKIKFNKITTKLTIKTVFNNSKKYFSFVWSLIINILFCSNILIVFSVLKSKIAAMIVL